ncbi:hypothetical protein D6T63_18600 [Arthrobacter cheniae]|uniref:Uncharacterized protein n=1 Tax=Arthrobacter cheniae TaxID=1258888 RepID=A0A3A5LWP3_9MICC|nr:hypothetical protein [Arthrobacter cheniae]RJT74403.1 hypothetical protein D6T63_18600 [Arthrobacter cheniae]
MAGPQDEAEETQRALINAAMVASDVPCSDVWLRYFALGGALDDFDLDAFFAGLMSLPLAECNLVAEAVNELIAEQPPRPKAPHRNGPPLPPETCGRGDVLDELLRQWLFGTTS